MPEQVRIVLRPIGSPLPLGFLGLGVGTFTFSALQLGWVEPPEGHVVAITVLAFTVPLQLLASVLGFLARDPVAGTGMGLLSGTWAVAGTVTLTSPPASTSEALGVALLGAALALLVPVSAATGKLVAGGVLAAASARFAATGLAQLTGSDAWETAAGLVGLVLAGLALYAAFGFELEDVRHRTVLPLLRRGEGREAMISDVDGQLAELPREAGVRSQL